MKALRLLFIPLSVFLLLLLAGCAARTMSGIVIDKNGNNIPEVYIQVKGVPSFKNAKPVPVAVEKTDLNGKFVIDNLRRYRTYSLIFSKKNYRDTDIVYDLRAMSKEERESLKIELDEVGLVGGVVVDRDGNGIPFVSIVANTDSGESVSAISDEMGNFSIKGLEGDKIYKLSFGKFGYVPENNVEFNLKELSENERMASRITLMKEMVEVKGTIMKLRDVSGEPLFTMNSSFQKYLNEGIMTDELLNIFNANNIELKDTEVIHDAGSGIWWIAGRGAKDGSQYYYGVKMEMNELKVYNPVYTPFEGLKVELKKSGSDELTWETTTDAAGKFSISEQITGGAFRIIIINPEENSKYITRESVPSDLEYFRLEAGDSMDIGLLVLKPLPSIQVGVSSDERGANGGFGPRN